MNQPMKKISLVAATALAMLSLSAPGFAGPREDQLAQYASAAKAANPAFAGFSADRGKTLHTQAFAGGKPDTPACTTCHGKDTRAPGRNLAGKVIDPVALSVSPSRYSDPAKVEKWFKRNCNEVLGRECNAQEKGDWLSFMFGQ
ncbi:MAG: DUF1924 domain-containing protein [Rhodocyclaceae bacterium]